VIAMTDEEKVELFKRATFAAKNCGPDCPNEEAAKHDYYYEGVHVLLVTGIPDRPLERGAGLSGEIEIRVDGALAAKGYRFGNEWLNQFRVFVPHHARRALTLLRIATVLDDLAST
jgi:hypothetical protein